MEYGHGWAMSFLESSDYSSPVKSTTGNSSSSRCEASTSSSFSVLSHQVKILESDAAASDDLTSVSYTHLTLPTKRIV